MRWPARCANGIVVKLSSQVVRLIVAAPGSMSGGRYPVDNTGMVDAGFMPMAIPDDLASPVGG